MPITSLASQIPEYGGTDDENIRGWTQRVDHVARVHAATDGAILLAATNRLIGSARRWFDLQTGDVIESWVNVRQELIKIFDKEISFHKALVKIEERKWKSTEKTFDRYALDKFSCIAWNYR